MVEAEFTVDEGFIEHNIPTFHVKLRDDSKEAFLRLLEQLKPMNFIANLRASEGKAVLRIVEKPPVKPSRPILNWVLFFVTLGTVLFAGYLQSLDLTNPWIGAIMFAAAMMGILGSHEMGHKLSADSHDVDATYPYFIPGPPPLGTFGALIQQKALPPNRDSLFDVGVAGPLTGFILAIIVTILGVPLSIYVRIPSEAPTLGTPLLFLLIESLLPPGGPIPPPTAIEPILAVQLHPVAFAGWVGMVVTMLNLIPAGMLDGGHVARSFLGERTRTALSLLAIAFLVVVGLWPWAIIAFFFSMYRHPGPLDDVSPTTTRRKLIAIALLAVFIICIPLPAWFYDFLPI
jgi:membrane-associated protease RseP (regulator of RpoE activity)